MYQNRVLFMLGNFKSEIEHAEPQSICNTILTNPFDIVICKLPQPPYGKTTALWKDNRPMERQPPYGKTTTLWKDNRPTERQPPYEKTTALWKDNHPMERQPPYGKTTALRKDNRPTERHVLSYGHQVCI